MSEDLENGIDVTYKYYDVAVNNNIIDSVNTIEEAEQLVNIAREEDTDVSELNIIEKYTSNIEEVSLTTAEIAKNTISEKINQTMADEKQEKQKQEEENSTIANINGIKIATQPVSGIISSRYGVSSRIRSSDHTGLDIATSTGTPIKVVASGTVIKVHMEI